MAFRVHERNGMWAVSKDAPGVYVEGGVEIDYNLYKKLKDAPHEAANHVERDKNNKLVLKKPKK